MFNTSSLHKHITHLKIIILYIIAVFKLIIKKIIKKTLISPGKNVSSFMLIEKDN